MDMPVPVSVDHIDHPLSKPGLRKQLTFNLPPNSMHLRTSKRPPLESKNRNDLTSTQCREADAFLKELRSCAQQLSPLETTLNDELRILERLYYKGVNQHRSALFWRRVEEMRKFGRRIAEMKLALMVEDLRFAFYLPEGAERQ